LTTLDSAIFADIVLVVDESSSMQSEHAWLTEAMSSLEGSLTNVGIGPNQYSLIGYGRASDPNPIDHLLDGTVAELTTAFNLLTINGNIEDGYKAIDFAIDEVSFRTDSARLVILVTDEDRDVLDTAITKTTVFQKLINNEIQLNSVVNAKFTDNVIAVNADGVGFFSDGLGGIASASGHTVTGGIGNTVDTYVQLGWSTGGSAYNLNALRSDASLFSNIFVEIKTSEITGVDPTDTLCKFTVSPTSQVFFCPEVAEGDEIVRATDLASLTRENSEFVDFISELTSTKRMHFSLSIYADPEHTSLLYTAFSSLDQKRWFVGNPGQAPCSISVAGATIANGIVPDVFYAPEVLPSTLIEDQLRYNVGNNRTEVPLVCGVIYYFIMEGVVDGVFYRISSKSQKFSCSKVKRNFWKDNFDAGTWQCSGQGGADFRISRTSNQSLNPNVAGNDYGNFAVCWQDFRETMPNAFDQNPNLFYGVWESDIDTFWTSGQGRSDIKIVSDAFRPITIADQANNFVFSGIESNKIKRSFCPQPTIVEDAPLAACAFSDDEFFDIDNTNRQADQYLKARVYEQDVVSSFAIAHNNVVSVVNDCFVRLDVIGAPGTYAVRIRNEDQDRWGSWIDIDGELPATAEPATRSSSTDSARQDRVFSAYFIDNDRFILPWVMSPGNGVKRVCLQILTYFGITKVFCLNVFTNLTEMEYKVELAYDSSFVNLPPEHKGLSVIGNLNAGQETTVFVKVTFTDTARLDKYALLQNIEGFSHLANNKYTFNFIQQGVNDQYGIPLYADEAGVYTGSFTIQNSDGIYNKDGLCAIVVNIPNPCTKLRDIVCVGSGEDLLNTNNINALQDFYVDYSNLDNITPEQTFEVLKNSQLAQITDIESFKQLYSIDDSRFSFGNPAFFIRK